MASWDIIFILFILTAVGNTQDSFVTVQCNRNHVGVFGHQALLDCVIKVTIDESDSKVSIVIWKKNGVNEPLVFFHDDVMKTKPGYRLAEPSWNEKNLNVSLLITNTAVSDEGTYTLQVFTNRGDNQGQTSLSVKAKYSFPTIRSIPEKMTPQEDTTLICQSDGGYPKGELRWFDVHNKEWKGSSQMEAEQLDSGLFQLTSKLSLLRSSTFSRYTCAVFNASGDQEEATIFERPPAYDELEAEAKSNSATNIVAPVVVIGSLIVGLLIALLCRRRSQNNHGAIPTSERDVEEGDHQKIHEQYKDGLA